MSDDVRPDPATAHPALTEEHRHEPRVRDASRIHPPRRRVALTGISAEPLDVRAHEAAVNDVRAGAVVTFSGEVRDHDGGRPVTGIEYLAHPTAARVLAEVVAEVVRSTDAEAVAVTHRVGELAVGESAIVVAASAAHRHEAFAACALLVDEVKHRLPVWKRQVFADGTDEWVACP
ncbi:MAG: molybdenum cofactor biosynthesis protein MoaE [Kineosporiaceae bacterium]